ncbi:hypothetical protein ACFVKB_41885 [Rhodococcus sp. NPDC127530]|uniref:hypothetical protein n=1 Tax=unclassified Rhodococcus (in: high G+C Gram-positive bacteria) TaxID=192944 RepID=UPI00363B7EE3
MLPATALIGIGSDSQALTAKLGLEAYAAEGATQQVCIVVTPPAPLPFAASTEEDLEDAKALIADVVHSLQSAVTKFREQGIAHGSVAVLVPAKAVLGESRSVLPGLVGGAVLSLCRTMAIELKKDSVSLNTVLHGDFSVAECAAIASLLHVFRSSPALTGQEIYTADGPDLGRIKP